MKKNLQRFGASVLAAAMVAQSVALPAAAETTKIDSSVAQSVAASAASAASAVQSLPKFTSTADPDQADSPNAGCPGRSA